MDADEIAGYERLARAALPSWQLPAEQRLDLVNLSENATFRLADDTFLRVGRRGYQSTAAVRSELAWARAVRRDTGLVTPQSIPTAAGHQVHVLDDGHGPRHIVRFHRLPGTEPGAGDLDAYAGTLGRIAARLHSQSAAWRPPAGFTRFRWDLPAILGPAARWGDWRHSIGLGAEGLHLLGRTVQAVTEELIAYGTEPDRFGLVHADMRLANLLVDGGSVAVIDFDDCGWSWFLFDLAATLSFVEDDPRVPQWCDRWLDGYRQVRPLPPAAHALATTFVLVRRIQLTAWLASHREIPLATELGSRFTDGTCTLAERWLLDRAKVGHRGRTSGTGNASVSCFRRPAEGLR